MAADIPPPKKSETTDSTEQSERSAQTQASTRLSAEGNSSSLIRQARPNEGSLPLPDVTIVNSNPNGTRIDATSGRPIEPTPPVSPQVKQTADRLLTELSQDKTDAVRAEMDRFKRENPKEYPQLIGEMKDQHALEQQKQPSVPDIRFDADGVHKDSHETWTRGGEKAWKTEDMQRVSSLKDASEFLQSIKHPDANTQSKLRAQAAIELINSRIRTVSDVWRPESGDFAQLAWDSGKARCGEHAQLLARMLKDAGEKTQIVHARNPDDPKYIDGHDFVLVNMPSNKPYNLQDPKTWGSGFAADSFRPGTVTSDPGRIQQIIGTRATGEHRGEPRVLIPMPLLEEKKPQEPNFLGIPRWIIDPKMKASA